MLTSLLVALHCSFTQNLKSISEVWLEEFTEDSGMDELVERENKVWFGLVGSLSYENDPKQGSSNILNIGFVFTGVVEPLIVYDGLFLCPEKP
ncbi:unnamed protein product [Sphenostylis stenocarpa]|uniref:Uncharacterized protein n=1 Tax=Sphenostylis stenocarpa TaxID=92480 RepID=A0AA86W5U4_9FABA|nr:unnamed protein product [Sphenostylis stenocarpa]